MSNTRKRLKRPPASDVVRKDSPSDYTGDNADERVLYINLYFIKFGSTDRLQGAALMLSMVLLFLIALSILGGFVSDSSWAKEAIAWLGTPLMLVVGVAVGRALPSSKDSNSQ